MVKIVWTEMAVNDLKEIFDYISEDSNHYANKTVNMIYQKAQIISVNLYAGRVVPEFSEPLLRELIFSNYRIVYRIKNEVQVDILRVYHSARLLKRNRIK